MPDTSCDTFEENCQQNKQLTEWKVICQWSIQFNKGLISKSIRNSYNLKQKKTPNKWALKYAEDLNRHLSKKDMEMAKSITDHQGNALCDMPYCTWCINNTVHSTNHYSAVKNIYGHIASSGQNLVLSFLIQLGFITPCASICCLASTRWRLAFWLIPSSCHSQGSSQPPHLLPECLSDGTSSPPLFATGRGQDENWKAFPPAFL